MIYDITRDLLSAPPYPGDPAPQLTWQVCMGDGACYNLSSLSASTHAATHIDAPKHFIRGGKPISALSPEIFIGTCRVLTIPSGEIDVSFFDEQALSPRLLLRGNGVLTEACAAFLVAQGIRLIGTDRISIAPQSAELPLHRIFLFADVPILENLDLSAVSDGVYELFAPPLKLGDAEAAPCRALLFFQEKEK